MISRPATIPAMTNLANPTGRGAQLTRVNFNPSGDDTVNQLKDAAAHLIDLIDAVPITSSGVQRHKALAVTHAETAAMFAVKAATTGK